ncbi:ABC transporter substrate-binding protein [Amycolatopsis sp. NPDC059657]|uniref:ABC transporter substrate-binding protein n=1 Tax=Amycolatopsis sp. NPDC059657 TaxID=3346899 RepID=UPI00366EE545
MSHQFSRRGFLGIAAVTLAGCGFAPPEDASKSLTFRWWGGNARNEAYQNAVKIFTQKTGIAVTTQYSGYDGYFDKLNTEFAGGNPPDLFQMDTALVSTYAGRGVLTDLGTHVPTTIGLDTLYPAVRSAGVVKGKTYGVPSGSGFAPVIYDKTVLDQLQIPVPSDDWTWAQFGEIAGQIAKAWGPDHFGAVDASKDDSGALQPWLRQRGKDLYTADQALGFGPDELTEWFTFWDGLRKSGAVCPPTLLANVDAATGNHPLIAGQVALTTGWGLAQMQPLTQHNLKVVVAPRGADGKSGQALSGGVLLSIPVKSRNPASAAKLIDFFLNDVDAIKTMGLQRGLPPSEKARKTLAPSITASENADVDYGQYVAAQVAKDALPAAPAAPPGYGDVKTALESAAKQIAFGKVSISAGVTQFFSEAKTALTEAK